MKIKKEDKLPKYGCGPLYGLFSLALTILSLIYFNKIKPFQIGIIDNLFLKKCFLFFSIISILFGVCLWCYAVFPSAGIRYKLEHGQLETGGAYRLTRNPIYSAIFFILLGIQMFIYNLFIFVIPFIIYEFLDILLRKTEEKWCLEKFGKKYEEYCSKVNRIIPWLPKK